MTTSEVPAPDRLQEVVPGEDERLRECAAEPIHRPGYVQPHGVLLAVDPATGVVVQLSANVGLVGRTPDDLLGAPLGSLLAEPDADALLAGLRGEQQPVDRHVDTDPMPVEIGLRRFDAIAHRSADGLGVVELEPSDATPDRWLSTLHASIQRLSRAVSVDELRQEAAATVRRLTGFDRVMVYHFHPDGHGEVVAEERAPHLEPYLGLHYPASDIPAQARRLYVARLSRTIPDRDYVPAPLVPALNPLTAAPTDLSQSELRSVSPHHLTFMGNMGVAASLSISLVHDGELIGMISCNNDTPRHVPYGLRRGCEILGQQVALQARALTDTRRLERRLELQAVRALLADQLGASDDVAASLVARQVTVADVVRAEGVVVRLDGQVASLGDAPDADAVEAVVAALTGEGLAEPVVTSALSVDRPDLAVLLPGVAGAVVVPVGDQGDVLAWFRPAFAQVVEWLGDQSAGNRDTPLSPRNSFHRWRETVDDRSLPWDDVEVSEALALRDVLVRHLAQARARRAAARAALTARVTSRLAETLDAEEAVTRLARLVVPELADWCVVSLVEEDHPGGRRLLRDVASWHQDPERRALVERYAGMRRAAMRTRSYVGQALESGEVVVVERDATAAARAVLRRGEAQDLLTELAPESGAVLPLRARNRTVGLITLYTAPGRRFAPDSLTTAQEVAVRAGLALDNARLYREQLLLAEGLQRSLLTEPPRTRDLAVAVRYSPAAEAAKVGGDWYDAFVQPGGAMNLVIGDVTGHDVIAAAAMGQLRSLVRGIAATTDARPAEVLQRVDRAIETLRVDTVATAVLLRIEPAQAADGSVDVRWSSAGHPTPLVLLPDGSAYAPPGRPDLVLGVVPTTQRHEHHVTVPRGSVLLLHTDGLVERRGERLQDGLERLRSLLEGLGHHDVESLSDELLDGMLPERPDDDVAIVVARVGG